MEALFKTTNKIGFTLAEVLVTLAVIGIVAALTIPSLLKDYQTSQQRNAAKNAYSFLSQAFTRMQANNTVPDFSASASPEDLRDDFCNQMNCIKTGVMNEFFAPYYYFYENTGAGKDYSLGAAHSAVLSNGMSALFGSYLNDCTTNYGGSSIFCGYMYVDTNAKSGPNMFGKDYILFHIARENGNYQVLPSGSRDGYTCEAGATDSTKSTGCTSYYILNKELP